MEAHMACLWYGYGCFIPVYSIVRLYTSWKAEQAEQPARMGGRQLNCGLRHGKRGAVQRGPQRFWRCWLQQYLWASRPASRRIPVT